MKKLITLISTLFVILGLQAQSDINIIYVDLNKLDYEKDYINKIINPIIEKPFVLFISNGSDYSFIEKRLTIKKIQIVFSIK